MSVASLVPDVADTTLGIFAPAWATEGANAVSVSAATVASAATRPDDAIGPFRLNISNFLSWIPWPRRPVVANLQAKPGFLQTMRGQSGIKAVTCRSDYKGYCCNTPRRPGAGAAAPTRLLYASCRS